MAKLKGLKAKSTSSKPRSGTGLADKSEPSTKRPEKQRKSQETVDDSDDLSPVDDDLLGSTPPPGLNESTSTNNGNSDPAQDQLPNVQQLERSLTSHAKPTERNEIPGSSPTGEPASSQRQSSPPASSSTTVATTGSSEQAGTSASNAYQAVDVYGNLLKYIDGLPGSRHLPKNNGDLDMNSPEWKDVPKYPEGIPTWLGDHDNIMKLRHQTKYFLSTPDEHYIHLMNHDAAEPFLPEKLSDEEIKWLTKNLDEFGPLPKPAMPSWISLLNPEGLGQRTPRSGRPADLTDQEYVLDYHGYLKPRNRAGTLTDEDRAFLSYADFHDDYARGDMEVNPAYRSYKVADYDLNEEEVALASAHQKKRDFNDKVNAMYDFEASDDDPDEAREHLFSTTEVPGEDKMQRIERKAQIAAAPMFVNDLNPKWIRGGYVNRPIDNAHVKTLGKKYRIVIRRTEPGDQLKVTVTLADYYASLAYTVEKYQQWHAEDNDIPLWTLNELDTYFRKLKRHPLQRIQDSPVLVWDPSLPNKPQLDAGQHRARALTKEYNPDNRYPEITPKNVQWTGWVVKIIDCDKVPPEYYMQTRANQQDIYKADSEGDVFVQLDAIFDEYLEEEKDRRQGRKDKKKKNADSDDEAEQESQQSLARFETFVKQKMQLTLDNPKRYQQLMNDSTWRLRARIFCSFAWGRQSFAAYLFTTAASHLMDEFYMKAFEDVFRKMRKTFGNDKSTLTLSDVKLLNAVGNIAQNKDSLRVLFYPTKYDDNASTALAIKQDWFSLAEYADCKLSPAHTVGTRSYSLRRPEFLQSLGHEAYGQLYEKLTSQAASFPWEIPLPSSLFSLIRDVMPVLHGLASHMIFWVDPTFSMPRNNQTDRRRETSLIKIINEHYTSPDSQLSEHTPGTLQLGTSDEIEHSLQTDAIAHSEEVALTIFRNLKIMVTKDLDQWKMIGPKNWRIDPKFVGAELHEDTRHQYRQMLSTLPWSNFVDIALPSNNMQALTGVMKPWIKSPALHRDTVRAQAFQPVAHTFYVKHSSRRMGELKLLDKYDHSRRVACAIEQAVLTEEARTLQMMHQDVDRVKTWQDQEAKRTGRLPAERAVPETTEDSNHGERVIGVQPTIKQTAEEIKRLVTPISRRLAEYGIEAPVFHIDNPITDKEFDQCFPKAPSTSIGKIIETSDYEGPDVSASTKRKRASKPKSDQPPAKKAKTQASQSPKTKSKSSKSTATKGKSTTDIMNPDTASESDGE